MAASKAEKNPSFFKFFLPGVTDRHLRIPQAFLKHLDHGSRRTVSVQGPSGNIRLFDLVEDANGLLFQDEWKEFARENCLEVGYLLIFRYDVNSSAFTMQVFDTSGCNLFLPKSGRGSSSTFVEEVVAPLVSQQSAQHLTAKCNPGNQRSQLNASGSGQAKKKHETVDKPRYGSLTSQRRNVTGEEKIKAVDKARSLKLHNPSVAVVMLPHHVYHAFYMAFPRKFVGSYLPKENCLMTVWDPTGRKWRIKFVYNKKKNNNLGALSAGWKFFSIHNNLEEGDVCVFECVKNHELRVHIFRVVEEISPLINNVLQNEK